MTSQQPSLLSDQVTSEEITVIMRELEIVLDKKISGDVVEFGCYVGTTSVFLAKRLKSTNHRLYLYDSFEGLPKKSAEDESPAGMQFTAGELHATKKQLIRNLKQANVPLPYIRKSWFSDLTGEDVPKTIAFAFLDGDYYHSILDPLTLIWDHLTPHATIIIDDYANEALPGAARAVDEWLYSHPAQLRVERSLGIIRT